MGNRGSRRERADARPRMFRRERGTFVPRGPRMRTTQGSSSWRRWNSARMRRRASARARLTCLGVRNRFSISAQGVSSVGVAPGNRPTPDYSLVAAEDAPLDHFRTSLRKSRWAAGWAAKIARSWKSSDTSGS